MDNLQSSSHCKRSNRFKKTIDAELDWDHKEPIPCCKCGRETYQKSTFWLFCKNISLMVSIQKCTFRTRLMQFHIFYRNYWSNVTLCGELNNWSKGLNKIVPWICLNVLNTRRVLNFWNLAPSSSSISFRWKTRFVVITISAIARCTKFPVLSRIREFFSVVMDVVQWIWFSPLMARS